VENVSGIRPASDVPVGCKEMDEESHIYQRVRNGGLIIVHQDVEAFCSRGGGGTVVIGVS
jgi:hypothetical protein